MPEIKHGYRKKGPKEKMQEVKEKHRQKKNKGDSLTKADLEERLEVLEEIVLDKV